MKGAADVTPPASTGANDPGEDASTGSTSPGSTSGGDASAGGAFDTRICYVVLSHQRPWLVQRLVDAIRRSDPDASVVIRHDQFASGGREEPLPVIEGAHVIGVARPAAWGSYELTESILDAWHWAREHLEFDWIVLLTGQDYLARPLSELKAHLATCGADALMELDQVGHSEGYVRARDVGAELYRYRYYGGPRTSRLPWSRMGFLLGVARWQPFVSVRVNPRVHQMIFGYRSPRAPFSKDFPPIWARNWVALGRPALDTLLDYVDTHPEYVEHYRRTFHSAESFFQTILWGHPDIRLRLGGLHYERWDPAHASPEVLDIDDLEPIVASGAFFVRKLALGRGRGITGALDALTAGRDPGEVVREAMAARSPSADRTAPPSLVSVILPMRNAEQTLAEQLDALSRQTYTGAWELLVADNGSSDRSREIALAYVDRIPGLRVLDASERIGAAHARNIAAGEARGDVLAFCDSDDIAEPDWLEAIADAMTGNHFVGGRLVYTQLNPGQRPSVVDQDDLEVHLGYLPAASSSNMAMSRALFEELGGFDESYASYGEDTDLSWRAQLAGYPLVYAKDAVVVWRSKASTQDWLRQVYRTGRMDARLYRDYRGAGLRRSRVLPLLRTGAWIVLHAPRLVRDEGFRARWLQWLAYRGGRLRGSVAYRVLFP
jgi:GT2 family glycosyltransferase